MNDDVRGAEEIDAWLVRALDGLDEGRLRGVLGDVAGVVRRRNQDRMLAQRGPDGERWAPRRRQTDRIGRVRRAAKMMRGLRRARRLRIHPTGDGADIGWRGRDERIAAVHHFGGVDQVDEGIEADYPARPLLGLAPDDIADVRRRLLDHLAGAI